jgi:hypothetical protein
MLDSADYQSVTESVTALESLLPYHIDQVSTAGVEISRSASDGHTGTLTIERLALSHILDDGCMASSSSRC